MIQVSAFRWVPPFAQGQVRDLRVRWALNEAGLPHEARLLDLGEHKRPEYREAQPFGQVPVMWEEGRPMFESGAICLAIAERSEALMPRDADGRRETIQWLFASLNTIETPIMATVLMDVFIKDRDGAERVRPELAAFAGERLGELQTALGDREHIAAGRFTVADLMLTTVLRIDDELLAGFPALAAYRARHEARPAFTAALEAQLAPFRDSEAARRTAAIS